VLRQIAGAFGTVVPAVMAVGGIYVGLTTTISESWGTSALVVAVLLVAVVSLGIAIASRSGRTATSYW
jgi:hypothetical protein